MKKEDKISQMREAFNKADGVQQSLNSVTAKYDSLQNKYDHLDKENERRKKRNTELREEHTTLQNIHSNLQKQYDEAVGSRDVRLKEADAEISRLSKEVKDLNDQIASLKNKKTEEKKKALTRIPVTSVSAVNQCKTFHDKRLSKLNILVKELIRKAFKDNSYSVEDLNEVKRSFTIMKMDYSEMYDKILMETPVSFFQNMDRDSYDENCSIDRREITEYFRNCDKEISSLSAMAESFKSMANKVEDQLILDTLTLVTEVVTFNERVVNYMRIECNIDVRLEGEHTDPVESARVEDNYRRAVERERVERVEKERVERLRPHRRRLM